MDTIFVADGHCDYLYSAYYNAYDMRNAKPSQTISLQNLTRGGVKIQFFAAWIDHVIKKPYLQQCLRLIDVYHQMLEKHANQLVPLTPDFDPNGNKIATVLTVEGGEAIEGDLAFLRVLKRLGVSAMTLTWNYNNEIAGASMKRSGRGLTAFGRDVIGEMERIGMAVDVSHLSDAAIDDILEIAKQPIFASHSNAREAYYSPRALHDEHIRRIAKMGGVIGVNFFHQQLCGRERANIEDIVRHILHIVEIGGVGCCCFGSDFDGMIQYPVDLPNPSNMQMLIKALFAAGLQEEEIQRIAYQNLHDYILRFV